MSHNFQQKSKNSNNNYVSSVIAKRFMVYVSKAVKINIVLFFVYFIDESNGPS